MNKPNINVTVQGASANKSCTYVTKILKGNIPFAEQIGNTNIKYVIKWDFDLAGNSVTIPEGCLIEMDGGTISNGTMVGDHTILIYFQDFEDCIKSVAMQGTWKYNNPRDGIMTENIYDENLDETQKTFNARVQAALTEANRRAQAVIPLPDEEDLTTDGGHNIKLKNKAYAPAQFSGLGKTYLRKNIVEIALLFDGFVEDVTLEEEGLTSAPVAIFFDSTNGIFVGIDNLLDPKYYGTWLNGSAYNTEGTLADDDEFKNTSDDTYYKYDGGALVSISTPTTKNILTQEMLSQANTVYIIQYDYDLNGQTITVPTGCTLQFDGGSLKNGKIVFSNTVISGEPIIKTALEGRIYNNQILVNWFGFIEDGTTDNSPMFDKLLNLDLFQKEILFKEGAYYISRTVTFTQSQITIAGNTERWHGGGDVSIVSNDDITFFRFKGTRCLIKGINFSGNSDYVNSGHTVAVHFSQVDDADIATETDGNKASIDSQIINCHMSKFNRCIYAVGNQLRIDKIGFGQCNVGVELNALSNAEITPVYFGSTTRNIAITNCTFHGMLSAAKGINIVSDLCIGLVISGNYQDCGSSFIYGTLIRSLVENNFVSEIGMYGIYGKCEDTIISGNTFLSSYSETWYSSGDVTCRRYPALLLNPAKKTVISNNFFGECNVEQIRLGATYETIITGNIFRRWGQEAGTTKVWAIEMRQSNGYRNITISNNMFYQENTTGSSIIRIKDNDYRLRTLFITNNVLNQPEGSDLYAGIINGTPVENNAPYIINNLFEPERWIGVKQGRPVKTRIKSGIYFDTTLGKPIWFNGANWISADGSDADVRHSGTFAQKPSSSGIYIGFRYLCTDKQTTEGTTNGIPIFYKGQDTTDPDNPVDVWVDALGRVVS